MASQPDLATLQREREKHEAALSGVTEKITAIEEAQRCEREERERRECDLAELRSKLERCQTWIPYLEKQIGEVNNRTFHQIDVMCQGNGQPVSLLNETFQEGAGWKLALAAFKEYEASLRTKIEAYR